MLKEIRERHKLDSEMYSKVDKLNHMVISQSHKDRAELLKLVDEIADILKYYDRYLSDNTINDIEDWKSKLD